MGAFGMLMDNFARPDLAVAFSRRTSSVLAVSSLEKWLQVYRSHRNADAYAVRYHTVQVQYRFLSTWHLQLRAQAQQAKLAKKADKFFVTRECWRRWKEKIAEGRRQKKLKEFEKKLVQRYYQGMLLSLKDRFSR